jgi:hypothetical protein
VVGVLAMVPRWWRQRSKVHKLKAKHGEPQNTQLGDSTQM